ncbi:16500_t:CDS:2, partial [Funneliformis geosporum]
INKGATYEISPSYPTFDIKSASPNTFSLIGEFLNNLDQKYNSNIYTSFEEAFLDEEITVNVIKDLSDEQLQKLGIIKIGWQKNINQEPNDFEMYK